ncbi:MAG TPA: adenylate/guanylate cyclase domain-containing protein [Stellaceae bacterium]|nr:adenylate/guanylate cyclase domain-containing protein [Stellaceae bacterium]
MSAEPPAGADRPRRPLFQKYFLALFIAVVVPLLASGAIEAWFGYRDERTNISQRLRTEANAAAGKIQAFLDDIRDQLEWTVQLPWSEGSDERHRYDVLRLLRQVPAIVDVVLVDGKDIERLHASRTDPDIVNSGTDHADDPAYLGARAAGVWYGPVTLHKGSEPYMTIAVAGSRESAGVTIAVINLKLIWDVISAIHVGTAGDAFALDREGHLVAHPDISLMLRGEDDAAVAALRRLQQASLAAGDEAVAGADAGHRTVLAAMARVAGPDWMAFVEQPTVEALAPLRRALWRTAILVLLGALFAAALAWLLARRMTGPIRLLEEGAALIGAGRFDQPIHIATGDELERLAARFNQMAGELALSQERSERIARLKRFLSPQVAELVEQAGQDEALAGHRAEVVVLFCDLRGFTAFSAAAAPEKIMSVLGDYYEALGAIIVRYEATLTSFSGDGLMLLLNAPMRCPDNPAERAVRMAVDMQQAVQALIVGWRRRGYQVGFGVGLARGEATVGRIGYEGRLDYTAIGSVTNLASRLCAAAEDRQILIDEAAAASVSGTIALESLGTRRLKGFDEAVPVFTVGKTIITGEIDSRVGT